MRKKVLVLSGRIASGKTSTAELVASRLGYLVVSTKDLLLALPEAKNRDRKELQALGAALDASTQGNWVHEGLRHVMERHPESPGFVLDSVRVREQIDALRKRLRNDVTHVHLRAPEVVLQKRFAGRQPKTNGVAEHDYFAAQFDATESQVESLAEVADAVIDTKSNTEEDILIRVAACLGFQSRPDLRLVDVVIGGQFGSEGKGQICAYLGPEYDATMRVGGPNAGHKVFEDPEPFTYHLLPSATRVSKGIVLLGPGMNLALGVLLREIEACGVQPGRLVIDRQAMIIEEADLFSEKELVKEIGSTGQGVGAATARRIMERAHGVRLAKDVPELKPFVGETIEVLEELYRGGKRVLLEGTQGTGLSLYHGTYPHVTSRDTAVSGTLSEAGIPPGRVNRVIMVVRTYPIRVGNPAGGTSGPMSNELTWEEISTRSKVPMEDLQRVERTSTTNRERRVGEFDWHLLRRSCLLNNPTDIALTFVDYLTVQNGLVRRFEDLSTDTIRFIDELERCAQAPVSLISNGFGHQTVIDRRTWRSSSLDVD